MVHYFFHGLELNLMKNIPRKWLIDLQDREDAPLVNSASYSDKERTVDPDYMTRINTEFMKAGVRGLTLVN